MDLSHDFTDLLAVLESAAARYLLIGGYAVSIHSRPRFTNDIGLLIEASPENLDRVALALDQFGAPPQAVDDVRTCPVDEIVWFGSPPGRVDVLKSIPGVDFSDAYRNRVTLRLGSISASVISRDDLIAAKRAAGRPQDLLDVKALEAAREQEHPE